MDGVQSIQCCVHGDGFEPVEIVSSVDVVDEVLGSKEKFWITAADGKRWLFKYIRRQGSDGQADDGSDWAELLVHLVAKQLGIPSACVALGRHNGRRGILSRSILDEREELSHGNELLARVQPQYDAQLSRANPLYTLETIQQALDGIASERFESAFEQFVSYLVLDALVAGRDRHHENWGVVTHLGRTARLAPSYDHGNALGFAEETSRAFGISNDRAKLQKWCRRGRSHHFANRPTLVDVALEGLVDCSAGTRGQIVQSVRDLDLRDIEEAAQALPNGIFVGG